MGQKTENFNQDIVKSNLKTKKQSIVETLQKVKDEGDFQFVAETTKEALKKSRVTKEPTPERFQKVSKLLVATVRLGSDYEKEVNKKLESEGKETDFKAKGTYTVPLETLDEGLKKSIKGLLEKLGIKLTPKTSKIIYKHAEKEQLYVRVYPTLAKNFESNSKYFDAFGAEISHEEWKKIEQEYFTLPSANKSQGLSKENTIIVNNYKLEGILYLGSGDKSAINELTSDTLKLIGE